MADTTPEMRIARFLIPYYRAGANSPLHAAWELLRDVDAWCTAHKIVFDDVMYYDPEDEEGYRRVYS